MPRTRNANIAIAQSPTCECCGRTFNARLTRSSVSGLCEACFDEAGMENAHVDGHHETPDANCHLCQNVDAHAGIRVGAAAGAGRVASEADGRLKANAPTVPETAKRVKVATQKGKENTKFAGMTGSVILEETYAGVPHYKVKLDDVAQVRWFYVSDVQPVRGGRRPARTAVAA